MNRQLGCYQRKGNRKISGLTWLLHVHSGEYPSSFGKVWLFLKSRRVKLNKIYDLNLKPIYNHCQNSWNTSVSFRQVGHPDILQQEQFQTKFGDLIKVQQCRNPCSFFLHQVYNYLVLFLNEKGIKSSYIMSQTSSVTSLSEWIRWGHSIKLFVEKKKGFKYCWET